MRDKRTAKVLLIEDNHGGTRLLDEMLKDERKGDEALRYSEAMLRRLLDSNIIGVVSWSEQGEILNANELFLKMTGYSQDDLRSKAMRWTQMTAPEFAIADATAQAEMATSGTCLPFEKELIRKDGSRITVLESSALLGQTNIGSSFVIDISERKAADARMRLQSAALSAAANGIVILDAEFSIVWVNPAFEILSGFSLEESVGQKPRHLFNSSLPNGKIFDDIEKTLITGAVWTGEMQKNRKDGTLYCEAQTITPLRGEQGQITHYIAIKSDLSEQRKIEAQLRQAHKMEAVGQLAAGVAHEFNNLLQGLLSLATVARLRATTPEGAANAAKMETQIMRGAGLTKQLLLFSRRQEILKSELDLGEEVRKAGVLLSQLIPANIRVLIEASAQPLPIRGDAGQIQQIILNMAINARDAMAAGGTLTLSAGMLEGEVCLEVADTGEGMNDATRARLFEPFFTTKEPGKGTGLGLAVVQGIVAKHGGRIEVTTSPGQGCRFQVILPLLSLDADQSSEENADEELPSANGRVLLVEDEEGVRAGVEALLELIGYEVTAVASGEAAMSLSLELAPDFLLSDIRLPGMTGTTLAEMLSRRWPALKVMLMSGYAEDLSTVDVGGLGWQFLQKPFELQSLACGLLAFGHDGPGLTGTQLLPANVAGHTRFAEKS